MELPLNYTFEGLTERAIRNARPRLAGGSPRWVAVKDTFATGSAVAIELCRFYGLDPHETVSGVHCISCEP